MSRTPIRRLTLAVALVLVGPAGAGAQSTFWRQARDPALARYRRELAAARELIDSTERGERERRELRERRLRAALDRLARAIQAAPNEVEARYRRASLLFDMDEFALAAADLEAARRIDPQSDWAEEIEFRLGVVYTKLGRFEEALAAYDEHLRLAISPGARAVGHGNAAETLMNLERIAECIESYRLSLREDPSYVLSEWGLAVALERDDRLAEARESVRRAIQLDPAANAINQEGVFFVPAHDVHWYRAIGAEARGELVRAQREWGLFLTEGGTKGPWQRQALRHLEAVEQAIRQAERASPVGPRR